MPTQFVDVILAPSSAASIALPFGAIMHCPMRSEIRRKYKTPGVRLVTTVRTAVVGFVQFPDHVSPKHKQKHRVGQMPFPVFDGEEDILIRRFFELGVEQADEVDQA